MNRGLHQVVGDPVDPIENSQGPADFKYRPFITSVQNKIYFRCRLHRIKDLAVHNIIFK